MRLVLSVIKRSEEEEGEGKVKRSEKSLACVLKKSLLWSIPCPQGHEKCQSQV